MPCDTPQLTTEPLHILTSVLNKYPPKYIIQGNHMPHLNKELRKAIMLMSRLKNKANKTKNVVDIAACRKQQKTKNQNTITLINGM